VASPTMRQIATATIHALQRPTMHPPEPTPMAGTQTGRKAPLPGRRCGTRPCNSGDVYHKAINWPHIFGWARNR
ncbi:hypothetical protein CKA53_30475, partial [Pseudomonas aeruginosa]